jgi:hypothetical protein
MSVELVRDVTQFWPWGIDIRGTVLKGADAQLRGAEARRYRGSKAVDLLVDRVDGAGELHA